jgi:hypothetical protein
MIASPIKMQFESVLKEQHLADAASMFADPDFFDEVPLYSRYAQVDFLKQYGDVDLLLMELSLDYLNRVTSVVKFGNDTRLTAITVIRDADDQYIVPSVLVCNGQVNTRLKELHLSSPSDGLGKSVESLVKRARLQGAFTVFEDRSTVAGDVRVFVGYKSPPEGTASLDAFATSDAGK